MPPLCELSSANGLAPAPTLPCFAAVAGPCDRGDAMAPLRGPAGGRSPSRPRHTNRTSVPRMGFLPLRHSRALPPLLAHAIEVMQWPHSVAQRMGVRNRGRDIRFGRSEEHTSELQSL